MSPSDAFSSSIIFYLKLFKEALANPVFVFNSTYGTVSF
jgi:hypothetical protein